tara:strand:+ start:984 stop:1451 length:468 start_codon:yes stop_codon:yes gene_type:complete
MTLKNAEKEQKVRNYLFFLLSKKDYTEFEVLLKLENKDYADESIAKKVVADFVEEGYIDDERCARILVRSMYENQYGYQKIKEKAYLKKIDENLIDREMGEYDFSVSCLALADKLVEKIGVKKEDYKEINKIKRKLLSRGFSFDQVNQAISEVIS